MDEGGLWRLFFLTGLPEAYLAVQGSREEERSLWEKTAKTAFLPAGQQRKQT